MAFFRYFRHKVAIVLTLFSACLSVLFCMLIFATMQTTDDYVRKALLHNHRDALMESYGEFGALSEPIAVASVQVLVQGVDAIPERLVGAAPGYYEDEESETHTLIVDLFHNQHSQRVYLVHTAEGTEALEQYELVIQFVLASVAILVTVIGSVLGIFLAGKIAKPAQELANSISKIDPDKPVFQPLDRKDEFGEISAAFSSTVDQINQVVEREKQFSVYASHELRTPVSIIKSSMSLWSACESKSPERAAEIRVRIADRIDRANKQMEDVIQTFLMLGKQDLSCKELEAFRLDDLLRELIEKYQTLNREKNVCLIAENIEPVTLQKNRKAVALVISNALRNAFDYSASEIRVFLDKDSLQISNDIDQLKVEQAEHFGFGLKIVSDLCDLLGWTYRCDHISPTRFVLKIRLNDLSDA